MDRTSEAIQISEHAQSDWTRKYAIITRYNKINTIIIIITHVQHMHAGQKCIILLE